MLPSFSLQIFGVSHRSESCEISLFFRFQAKRNFRFNFKFRFRSESEGAPYSRYWVTIFPSPAGMSLTKLSLAGNNLIISGLFFFSDSYPVAKVSQ
jgi:hypothetical protein